MDDIRALIREMLSEELSRLTPNTKAHEAVTIQSSADLNDFARRILSIAMNDPRRADILEGRHQFTLTPPGTAPTQAHSSTAPAPNFRQGIVTERDVAALPQTTRSLRLGKPVRLTPLARDELRRRGITIERLTS